MSRSTTLRLLTVSATLMLTCSLTLRAVPVDSLPQPDDPRPEYIADEVAAIVGYSHILLSDIEQTTEEVLRLRRQQGILSGRPARDEAFETLLLQKVLAEQARADSLNKDLGGGLDTQIEHQIQQMITEAGSVKALEKKYRK